MEREMSELSRAIEEAHRRELAGEADWTAGLREAVAFEAMDEWNQTMERAWRQVKALVAMPGPMPGPMIGR